MTECKICHTKFTLIANNCPACEDLAISLSLEDKLLVETRLQAAARTTNYSPSEFTIAKMVQLGQTRAISSTYTIYDLMRDLASIAIKGESLKGSEK